MMEKLDMCIAFVEFVALMNYCFKYKLGPICNSFQNEIAIIFYNLDFCFPKGIT